jgi:hypothetical protein
VTYFQSATRSFRAKATIVTFFMRPPLRWYHERVQRSPSQLLPENHGAFRIYPVKLKDRLGQIDPECSDVHVDGPFLRWIATAPAWHSDAVGVGPSTPSDGCDLAQCGQVRLISVRPDVPLSCPSSKRFARACCWPHGALLSASAPWGAEIVVRDAGPRLPGPTVLLTRPPMERAVGRVIGEADGGSLL